MANTQFTSQFTVSQMYRQTLCLTVYSTSQNVVMFCSLVKKSQNKVSCLLYFTVHYVCSVHIACYCGPS